MDGESILHWISIISTGKLLKPMGDLDFETAYEAYKEVMIYGEKAGADLIHIETMSDTYELKAAVLAAKKIRRFLFLRPRSLMKEESF